VRLRTAPRILKGALINKISAEVAIPITAVPVRLNSPTREAVTWTPIVASPVLAHSAALEAEVAIPIAVEPNREPSKDLVAEVRSPTTAVPIRVNSACRVALVRIPIAVWPNREISRVL